MNYAAYQSIGSYFNGVKVGKWTDVTRDSVVYAESFYDSTGNPKGVWKINYSNGLLGKTLALTSLRRSNLITSFN